MPFSYNRHFKQSPRIVARARGMYLYDGDGRQILDGCSALWCVNAGHCREQIVTAIQQTAAELDFASTFQMGHPLAFALAEELVKIAPAGLSNVFFCNSGSEAVESALKIALAYHQARGDTKRVRFVGRVRGYHGVGFAGISVGGIENNRRAFAGQLLPHVDLIRDTHDIARNAFSKGRPTHGMEFADDLERVIAERGAETIAAVIVEPMAGSTGVLIPPLGYLERLASICRTHGILLIFDEVITGFGRLGQPFASQYFNITPDIITVAKGLTNGAVPMGAAIVKREIYESITGATPWGIELFHGYTYSGHPLAAAAGLATLQVYAQDGLLTRAGELAGYWQEKVHSLRDRRHVIDIRNLGLVAAVEMAPRAGQVGARGYDALQAAFHAGLLVRVTGDIIALAPPLIVEHAQIDRMIEVIGRVIDDVA
jgi:beta-alanine--pyruvate transaminase